MHEHFSVINWGPPLESEVHFAYKGLIKYVMNCNFLESPEVLLDTYDLDSLHSTEVLVGCLKTINTGLN